MMHQAWLVQYIPTRLGLGQYTPSYKCWLHFTGLVLVHLRLGLVQYLSNWLRLGQYTPS